MNLKICRKQLTKRQGTCPRDEQKMVGPCGLEPQTSTVSKGREQTRLVTLKVSEAGEVPVSTAKTKFLQVKLQVKVAPARHRRSAATRLFSMSVHVVQRFANVRPLESGHLPHEIVVTMLSTAAKP